MADTPILNYKGKYDGPEIDKAVELALDLENPKSCPYHVHVSLSQPDYVLTIGLGDAEGNLFNHAEIDLPLESMVVNATYSNGNIILHLQDGTSTEPIPISALIAGLVSENRTIAGIDLKDDITPKELRDALDVYTKDSVDQLVTDLEDRIDETLNEMKQSLDDLSEQTSEHDTQIKKNTSDMVTNKSDIAINRATLGTQCKNIINNNILSTTDGGLTITVNEDKSVTFNGTATKVVYYWVYATGVSISSQKKLPRGKYILTGCPKGGKQETYSLAIGYRKIPTGDRYGGRDIGNGYTLIMDSDTGSIDILIQIQTGTIVDNLTFYPMLRSADITDPTYEPYVPSVNERLVDVEESVSELTPQVEQNKSDILKTRVGMGLIEVKNLFNKDGEINSIYSGSVVSNTSADFNTVDGNVITFNRNSSFEYPTGQFIRNLKNKKLIVSFNCLNFGTGNGMTFRIYQRDNPEPVFNKYPALGASRYVVDITEEKVLFCFGTSGGRGAQIENIMVRYAEIEDDTYAPFTTPDLQGQIYALTDRIKDLETALQANQTTE